ncbi:MAG: hybrid sensor histidine kinase/response regulator [Candidatus Anammoxibacter sp.]
MAIDRKKFLARFVEEAREKIAMVNTGLLILEKNPQDEETLDDVFRSIHTIKGTSRMMKLTEISALAHKMEDAFDALREKKIQHTKELADLFLKGVDTLSEMVDQTDAGQEITVGAEDLCEKFEKAANGETWKTEIAGSPAGVMEVMESQETPEPIKEDDAPGVPSAPKAENIKEPKPVEDSPPEAKPVVQEAPTLKGDKKQTLGKTIRVDTQKLDETIKLMGEILSNQSRLKQRVVDFKEIEELSKKNLELVNLFKKYDTSHMDRHDKKIINMAQTLHQKIKQLVITSKDDAISQELQTIELQEKALRMRMLPLSMVFDNFHREVRDMARSFGKDIDFVVEGGETELDKNIIEKLGDPLMHMIRNSLDHGIETPDDRLKAGKAANGYIRLSAYYEGGNVLIEVRDDGAGIPLGKIREKALQKDIFNKDELENMAESEIIDLIFHPGFSTSAFITDISGRGVGMDVVKKNIVEDLKGTINIETKESKGTCFFIRLPLTLSIMRVLQFTVSNIPFAIPVNDVTEILKIPASEIIDVVDSRAINLREEILPVANISDLLSIPGEIKSNSNELLIIMVNLGNEQLGLIVDSLIDEEDMVIKSLPSHMKNIQCVTGVAISGKDEIVSILNVSALIKASKNVKTAKTKKRIGADEDMKLGKILIVDDSINTREIEKSVLESYGYSVDVAEDGIDAIGKTNGCQYDLVVTDIEMPRMNGFSLTEKLRQNSEYKNTPIIILTSREKEEDKRRGMQAGANAYITKGDFDQNNLIETIQNLIS